MHIDGNNYRQTPCFVVKTKIQTRCHCESSPQAFRLPLVVKSGSHDDVVVERAILFGYYFCFRIPLWQNNNSLLLEKFLHSPAAMQDTE